MSDVVQASYRVEVDVKRVNELLTRLNDKEAKNAIKAGIRKSALIIRKQAQSNWISACPDGERLAKEINIAVYSNASGARIDLLNKRRPGSKQFVLSFFNSGTKKRLTLGNGSIKAGVSRGIINATYFFDKAVESKKREAEKSLEENILNSIAKAVNKKQ